MAWLLEILKFTHRMWWAVMGKWRAVTGEWKGVTGELRGGPRGVGESYMGVGAFTGG
jgi:hypothetical protein